MGENGKLGNLGKFEGVDGVGKEEIHPIMVIGVTESGKTFVDAIQNVVQNKKGLCVNALADALKIVAAAPPSKIVKPTVKNRIKGAFGR